MSQDTIKREFNAATTRSEYVKIAEKYVLGQDLVQFYKNLSTIEKDLLLPWLARGRAFEEAADPKNSMSLVLTVFFTVLIFILKDIILATWDSTCLNVGIIIGVFIILLSLMLLVGNLIGEKMKLSALNSVLTSAINEKE